MDALNCSTFADNVIEGMGWPGVFRDCPLLRTGLEFAVALGFEKFNRGDYGPSPSPVTFATHVESIADHDVVGRIDLLSNSAWAGRRDIRQAFMDAVAAGFAALTVQADEPAKAPAAGRPTAGDPAGGAATRRKPNRGRARKSAKSLRSK